MHPLLLEFTELRILTVFYVFLLIWKQAYFVAIDKFFTCESAHPSQSAPEYLASRACYGNEPQCLTILLTQLRMSTTHLLSNSCIILGACN